MLPVLFRLSDSVRLCGVFNFPLGFPFFFFVFYFEICSAITSKNVNSCTLFKKACVRNHNYACALAEHADF